MSIKRLIVLGPTASGKSGTAVQLAKKLQAIVVSADSRQVYKYLDIGTAKITDDEQQGITHLNLSILDPDQEDTAASFKKRAERWESKFSNKTSWFIYAGGSTLHLQSLLFPFDEIPPANEKNLREFTKMEEQKGEAFMLQLLQKKDAAYVDKMDGYNRQRIFRALDVIEQTGKSFSSFHNRLGWTNPEPAIVFGLNLERNELYDRINQRVEKMISDGLFDEYDNLLERGYPRDAQALRTVGYREITQGRELGWSEKDIIEKIKTNSRRYAKRQITFFKRWPFITWIDAKEKNVESLANEMLEHIKI